MSWVGVRQQEEQLRALLECARQLLLCRFPGGWHCVSAVCREAGLTPAGPGLTVMVWLGPMDADMWPCIPLDGQAERGVFHGHVAGRQLRRESGN